MLLSAHTWTAKHQITGYVAPLRIVFSTGAVPSFMPTFSVANSAALLPSAALVLTTPAGPSHLSSPPLTPPTPASSASIPGAALLPPKLVSKILRGEFIEMREMLPDAWVMDDQPTSCCRSSKPRRGGLITDIQLWVEGYASLVAVLTTEHPDKAPHFMAYLKTIVHASRNFEGSAWASYDAAYRRKAASTQSFDWAVIDSALYSEAFTGRARTLPRCRYCLSDTHHSQECPTHHQTIQQAHHSKSLDHPQDSLLACNCQLGWSCVGCLIVQMVISADTAHAGMPTFLPSAARAHIQPQTVGSRALRPAAKLCSPAHHAHQQIVLLLRRGRK